MTWQDILTWQNILFAIAGLVFLAGVYVVFSYLPRVPLNGSSPF